MLATLPGGRKWENMEGMRFNKETPEPWLRGTLAEVPAVARAVLHALQLAKEDLEKWCGSLTPEEMNARPAALPPVAFHLRHIARSVDRLLTYAERGELTVEQIAALKSEMAPGAQRERFSRNCGTRSIVPLCGCGRLRSGNRTSPA
jgi:hypothetical protein